jgi:hypothetical protein
MKRFRWPLAALVLMAWCGSSHAQTAAPAPAAASAPATAASAAPHGAAARRTVIEDKGVRIEETRVGGQARSITVQSKIPGARPYEIIVGPAGRDINKDHGSAGQSTWSIFDF